MSADDWQHGVRLLLLDDGFKRFDGQRFNVGGICDLGVGHDGGWVAVDQHHTVALLAQRLDGLRARVVELRGLADNDGARAGHQNGMDVSAFGHFYPLF